MEDTIRIVVAQEHCLLQSALIERLKREKGFEVCAVSTHEGEIRPLISAHRPHVMLIGASLKCNRDLDSLKKLKHEFSGMAILAYACDFEFENLCAEVTLRAGADGYVSFSDTMDNLVKAVRLVQSGERYVSAPIKMKRKGSAEHHFLVGLSRREAEVFCLTGCGHVPKSIAEMMNLSVKTVESYRERIRAKMDLGSGADLLYFSVSFMRNVAKHGIDRPGHATVKELLSAIV